MTTTKFEPQSPDYARLVRNVFERTPFIVDLGIRLETVDAGYCVTSLAVTDRHRQQNGFIHAGVISTMADQTAGATAGTLVKEGCNVLTVEYTIHFLRAARGESLRCEGRVIKPGKSISRVEISVYINGADEETLVSRAMVTLVVVQYAGS